MLEFMHGNLNTKLEIIYTHMRNRLWHPIVLKATKENYCLCKREEPCKKNYTYSMHEINTMKKLVLPKKGRITTASTGSLM
jgi:hypothetical protein